MSLAATLAAGGMRPASFLPTIKCSSCGDEIEISAMGEHTCTKAPPSPKAQPASLSNPFTLRQMNANNSKPAQPSPLQFDNPPPQQSRPRAPTLGSSAPPSSRIPRVPPPKINADVANMPFLAPLPRPESPISPAASTRSGSSFAGRQPPQRSMTSPAPRLWDPRPPSPELSANLDCAFPPFPFGEPAGSRPGSSNGRNTPSERGSSRADSRSELRPVDNMNTEPRSPMTKAGENIINRMNTLKGGPFDPASRRPSRDEQSQQEQRPLDRRRPSISRSDPSESVPPMPPVPVPSLPKPAEASIQPIPQAASAPDYGNGADRKLPPQRPERPDTLSPGLLNDLSTQSPAVATSDFPLPPKPLQPVDRSKTFPFPPEPSESPDPSLALSKVPSEPELRGRSDARPAMPEFSKSEPAPQFPSRSTSRAAMNRIDYRMQDAPPVPKPVQNLHRSGSSHRPSGSDSSSVSSTRSLENSVSSSFGASPVTSAASSVDAFSPLTNEASHMRDNHMRPAGLNIKGHDNPGMRAEMPRQRKSPPRNFARPALPPPPPGPIPEPPLESPVLPTSSNWPLESPMDPELQNGILGTSPQTIEPPKLAPLAPNTLRPGFGLSPADFDSDEYDPYRPKSPMIAKPPEPPFAAPHMRARSKSSNGPPSRPMTPQSAASSEPPRPALNRSKTFDQQPTRPLQPPPIPQETARPPLARRPTVAGAKPTCRGCGLIIEGRSVKAADGRLTGRWHKQCFVCKTCEQPFVSADFYVINNNPYCEQHYHEKNGSTCAGCRRGIEGPYLETSTSGPNGRLDRKFHPRCFTCFNCRVVLSEDYFEIAGRVFCERHALAAMRAQPRPPMGMGGPGRPGYGGPGGPMGLMPHGASGLKAERRTTKLMMM